MNYWTFARKLSLSALFFWQRLFASWFLAVPMVAVIDVPAMLGFALHIARIESPFVLLPDGTACEAVDDDGHVDQIWRRR